MKQNVLFISSILLFCAGTAYFFRALSAAHHSPTDKVSLPFFREKKINLGHVKSDSLYPVIFHYKTGQIEQAYKLTFTPSCGCTLLADNGQKTIKSNLRDSLMATINTTGKKGSFDVQISVLDSAYTIVDSLIIYGYAD
jgi:hypothetical protein